MADPLETLRENGYRITPQRVAVLQAIASCEESLTPAALYHRLRRDHPDIGLVTVYRTLGILARLGLVCEVRRGENTRHYTSRPPEHHDHLVCSGCGKVVNFTDCNMAELEEKLARETGFAVAGHHLEITGYCRDCHR